MVESQSWNWARVSEEYWWEPAEQVYYLAARWQRAGYRRFLDLGCGVGRHALFMAGHGFTVDALDLSPSGVDELKRTAQERRLPIRAQVSDMLSLPYPDAAFDCLLAFHVIFHSDRAGVERTVAEIERVLAPGGEAYLTFNSLSNDTFHNPRNPHIGPNTVMKTEGGEAGIPHYGVDEAEVRRLLQGFQFIRLTHAEEVWPEMQDGVEREHRSWHYFVLVRKP